MFQTKWQVLADEIGHSKDFQKLISHHRLDLLVNDDAFNTSLKSIFILLQWLKNQKTLFLVFSEASEAKQTHDTLLQFVDDAYKNRILYCHLPHLENPYEIKKDWDRDSIFEYNHLKNLLLKEKSTLVITTTTTLCKRVQKQESFLEKSHSFFRQEKISPLALKDHLESIGYHRVSLVKQKGEYSLRSDVVDVFDISSHYPFRFSFFDNEIEEIHFLDIKEQKIFTPLEEANIVPANYYFFPSKKEKREFQQSHSLNEEDHLEIEKQADLLYSDLKETTSIFSYSKQPLSIIWHQKETCQSQFENFYHHSQQIYQFSKMKKKETLCVSPENLFFSFEQMEKKTETLNKNFKIENFKTDNASSDEEGFAEALTSIKNNTRSQHQFKSHSLIDSYLKHAKIADKKIILLSEPRLLDDVNKIFNEYSPAVIDTQTSVSLIQENWKKKNLLIFNTLLSSGFEWEDRVFISTEEIFPRKKKKEKKSENKIEFFLDLKEGDYVVHLNHGIGKFKELRRLTGEENGRKIEKDYFYIVYANQAGIFVPVDQIHLLQKYVGRQTPKLDKIGGSSWEKIKNKVKKKVKEIASELVALYSKRQALVAQPFPRDIVWQKDFEEQFPHPLTRDQAKAVSEIKNDLESSKPMDRLLCGDVGFGKTEVAMRAIFKVVMANRQTAFIAPTTILSQQHYKNFQKRFENFPVNIALLNRFTSGEQETQILTDLEKGGIDILIGTHKLFSKKIKFANLGLLVIDEEHKFGVVQKEELRKKYPLVDTLALTATPIPRTLHMSLIDIRDISVIQTPPAKRKPIETIVTPFSEKIIVEVIENEIKREGQVYFIHNRIQDIHIVANLLKKHFPDLIVQIAHGKMSEFQLDDIMVKFVKNEFHILVSTTIIESGIDIPNVNTIIINNAHNLGLSQLHQIRGRIGRSDRKGFAYFFYDPTTAISEQSMKRLKTISEYSQLGAGFHIAMRDLEIRGTGNILGSEQSGNILDVGFDLYCQLLQEAIEVNKHKQANEDKPYYARTLIDLKYIAYIPDSYINDEKKKIQIYKKVNSLNDFEEIEIYKLDLEESHGKIPDSLKSLFEIAKMRILATSLGVLSIIEKDNKITLAFIPQTEIPSEKIVTIITRHPSFQFKPAENTLVFDVERFLNQQSHSSDPSDPLQIFVDKNTDGEIEESQMEGDQKPVESLQFKIRPVQKVLEYLNL